MRKISPATSDLPPIARVRHSKRTVACPVVNILCSCVVAGLEEFLSYMCCSVDIVVVAVSDWDSDWAEYLG